MPMKRPLYNEGRWAIIWTVCILILIALIIYEICDPWKQVVPSRIRIIFYIFLIVKLGSRVVVYIAEKWKSKK